MSSLGLSVRLNPAMQKVVESVREPSSFALVVVAYRFHSIFQVSVPFRAVLTLMMLQRQSLVYLLILTLILVGKKVVNAIGTMLHVSYLDNLPDLRFASVSQGVRCASWTWRGSLRVLPCGLDKVGEMSHDRLSFPL